MNGNDGFYIGNSIKKNIMIPLRNINNDDFIILRAFWILCSLLSVVNIFIAIFGFPLKYTVTFLSCFTPLHI